MTEFRHVERLESEQAKRTTLNVAPILSPETHRHQRGLACEEGRGSQELVTG